MYKFNPGVTERTRKEKRRSLPERKANEDNYSHAHVLRLFAAGTTTPSRSLHATRCRMLNQTPLPCMCVCPRQSPQTICSLYRDDKSLRPIEPRRGQTADKSNFPFRNPLTCRRTHTFSAKCLFVPRRDQIGLLLVFVEIRIKVVNVQM